MKLEKTLCIGGVVLITASLSHLLNMSIDVLLDKMLLKTALQPEKNNKQDLLVMAGQMINSNRDLFLEQ